MFKFSNRIVLVYNVISPDHNFLSRYYTRTEIFQKVQKTEKLR